MKYGYFDDPAREYVITNPRTPVKWINYIGTLNFGGFVDQTGGVLLCRKDPALNRITKYITQDVPAAFRASTIYLRMRNKNQHGWRVWSPFFVPTLHDYESYECRVGLNYTRIISQFFGVRCEVLFFVPQGAKVMVQMITLTNKTDAALKLDCIPVVEYTHPDSLKQLTNADWVPQTMTSKMFEEADGQKLLIQYPFMCRDTKINYFTASHAATSFETDRQQFVGDYGYCGWQNPNSLQKPELGNTQALRGDNIAALMLHVDELQPDESRTIVTLLGQAKTIEKARAEISRYNSPNAVEEALQEMRCFWDAYLEKCQVETPDADMNRMLNIHNPHQCYITKNWSRYLSLYQLGFGARGIGFRDSSQDVMGVIQNVPDEAKKLMTQLLSVQLRAGYAMHQFNPLTMEGAMGEVDEYEDRPHYYGDDHLWIILAACAYLKETGNLKFLNKKIPYYDKDKQNKPLEDGTVLDHLQRALEFTHNNCGAHGLPLAGFADWNDTVNLKIGAESVFNACLYGAALLEMIDLCKVLGEDKLAKKYKTWHKEMKKRFNEAAWDGDWYVRYFDHDGTVLGSAKNEHGKIYTNAQSWAVLAGFATPERAESALQSVNSLLNTKFGIKLSTPGFNGYDRNKGGITTYPPGAKENCGIFLHANPWVMIAETKLGHGERAFEYYNQINPANKNDIMEVYECEPYVYPQNILGDEHPQFGLARNTWLSGTSSWMYQAATKYILGIRPDYEGLCIDPCIPSSWDGFKVKRQFRGATYEISVSNPDHVCKGVKSISVDGELLLDGMLPVFEAGSTHHVDVVMG